MQWMLVRSMMRLNICWLPGALNRRDLGNQRFSSARCVKLQLKREQKLDDITYKKLHSTDSIPPAIRGSVKHHKPNNPLRPIVTCRNTALYNTSKFLANILSPLQNHNNYSVNNSTDFAKKLTETHIDDDEIMVFFDVVSLFTAIPVDKACKYIRNN